MWGPLHAFCKLQIVRRSLRASSCFTERSAAEPFHFVLPQSVYQSYYIRFIRAIIGGLLRLIEIFISNFKTCRYIGQHWCLEHFRFEMSAFTMTYQILTINSKPVNKNVCTNLFQFAWVAFTKPSAGKQLTTALWKNVMIAHFYNQGTG